MITLLGSAHRLAAGAAPAHLAGRRGAGRASRARSGRRHLPTRHRGWSPCRRARSRRSRVTEPTTCMPRPGATRSTSPSCSRAARTRSCRARSRTRCGGASRGSPPRSGAWSSSSRSCRTGSPPPCSTPFMPDWPPAAEEPERRALLEVHPRYVRFRHELARNAIRSSIPIAARRRLHAEILAGAARGRRRPGRHRPSRGGGGCGGRRRRLRARCCAAGGGARLEPRGVLPLSTRRRCSSTDSPRPSGPTVLEELAGAAYAVYRLDDAFNAIERAIVECDRARRRCGPRPLHADPLAVLLARRRR